MAETERKQKRLLKLTRLGIDTYREAILYLPHSCSVCRSEGFEAQARINVQLNGRHLIATLNIIKTDLLKENEASLSEHAWEQLCAKEGDEIHLSHPAPLVSLSYIRRKIYNNELSEENMNSIIRDVVEGRLSDIQISSFLTACADDRLNVNEILRLTKAMVNVGSSLNWPSDVVVDKHCIGGLPGNRTTLIVVPIIAAFGLVIPKTSSRAITSAAGTADTMETLAPVDLNFDVMRKVVEQENGCIVWGGAVSLSPADDVLIRVERGLNIDSVGQLIASVMSKKIAAGSTHVVIDIPVGETAKIRSEEEAQNLKQYFMQVAAGVGVTLEVLITDGVQPVGEGIGPALEARSVLAVLQNDKDASKELRERALIIAGKALEFSEHVLSGDGYRLAEEILHSGQAWKKFQAICDAQGGMREPPLAPYQHVFCTKHSGRVVRFDNRRLARLAKLAGAPQSRAAGVKMHVMVGNRVEVSQPILTIHAESKGQLSYALSYLNGNNNIIMMEEE